MNTENRGASSDEALVKEVCDFVCADPSFGWYVQKKFHSLADPDHGRRYRTRLRYELAMAGSNLADAVVVDAGCGAGIYSLLMIARGARHVFAIDYFRHNIEALERLTRRFRLPLTPILGDVAQTPCEDGSVDLIYCVEAISHFHSTEGFLKESARIARGGGRIVIADGNNGANPGLRRHIHDFWMLSETGPFVPGSFPPGDNLPFLYRRWMIIREAFPDLRIEDIFQLGMRTAGVGGEALIEECRRFVVTHQLPDRAYKRGMSQRRPEDGQLSEEPVNPFVLARQLRSLGFAAQARPHFGVSRGRAAQGLNLVGSWAPQLALQVAPTYIVFGLKRSVG